MQKSYFFNTVRAYRERADLSQFQLAGKCNVSRQTINSIENGHFYPSTRLALLIWEVLNEYTGCSFTDLFWVEHSNKYISYYEDAALYDIFVDDDLD